MNRSAVFPLTGAADTIFNLEQLNAACCLVSPETCPCTNTTVPVAGLGGTHDFPVLIQYLQGKPPSH